MTEVITQTRIEDAIDETNSFLQYERNTDVDKGSGVEVDEKGDILTADKQLERRILTTEDVAEELLTARPIAKMDGFYAPLSSENPEDFPLIAKTFPGRIVLVPAVLAGDKVSALYPAVVSEQDATSSNIRLHVFKQAYRQTLTSSAGVILSAGGQSETAGIGRHGHGVGDELEAEHFATIIAASSDDAVREAWQDNKHINHKWRKEPDNSVTTQMSKRLFGDEIPQSTISISKQAIVEGGAALLWHKGMRDQSTGAPESATRPDALEVMQALGFQALKEKDPKNGLDNVKKMVSA